LLFFSISTFGIAESERLQKESIKISFRSQFHGNSDFKNFKLSHPIKISHEDITNHLTSLWYKGTFLGNKKDRVFSLSDVKKLAPILVKAFSAVSPDKIIHIELKGEDGVTSGDVFSFSRYLNWRFDLIQDETFLQKNNVRGWNIFAWKMMPQKGQYYYKTKPDKRIRKNWIISGLKFPTTDRKNPNNPGFLDKLDTASSSGDINPKLEEKLKQLKYLYDKKLISKEEYKNQQNKIFEQLF